MKQTRANKANKAIERKGRLNLDWARVGIMGVMVYSKKTISFAFYLSKAKIKLTCHQDVAILRVGGLSAKDLR